MQIQDIIDVLERLAPPVLQESYDNSGLLTGNRSWTCTGILVSLDATEPVVQEAMEKGCNLIVSHHPILFKGLKKITGSNYVEKTIIQAIKNDIALYAIHTNLDNTIKGVSGHMANKLGLIDRTVLLPKENMLRMLHVYVPHTDKEKVLQAMFDAGAGNIGNYSECSYAIEGIGSFKPEEGADPAIGTLHERHNEPETKLELIFEAWKAPRIIKALIDAHPYEEVAYQVYSLQNSFAELGSGLVGSLPTAMPEKDFLELLQKTFLIKAIKHSPFIGKPIKKVAVCGGAGSFAIPNAKASKADVYVTSDLKYHEYFDADGEILLVDIGHYESEQFTIDLLVEVLSKNFINFAVLKTGVQTNPIHYFNG